jgi:hypothetical protein
VSERPTLSEIAQARPRRGAGAPARTRSRYEAILQLLRDRGQQGVLGSELYNAPERFGRSPRNRISELRRDGHLIEGRAHGSSDWFYCLVRELPTASPSNPPTHREDRRGVTGLPLFDLGLRR